VASDAPLLKTPILARSEISIWARRSALSIVFDERKIRCGCGYRGVERLDFVDKYGHHTTVRGVRQLAVSEQKMSLTDAADVTGRDRLEDRETHASTRST
jgi:hypothetical protein